MRVGDQVKIKPQWQDVGDSEKSWRVHSLENYPRILLVVKEQELMYPRPVYTVTPEMLEGLIA